MFLSIIIPVLNDPEEIVKTVKSILATADRNDFEIIVIDDFSSVPVKAIEGSTVFRNDSRIGVAQSRHSGAILARGEHLLFIDSHMRFENGWLEAAKKRISGRPTTMHCGVCLGLDKDHDDMEKHLGPYQGAYLAFWNEKENQILEGKWQHKNIDDEEIQCVMGASYFIPREFFFRIGGLKSLRMWGSDEPFLSLKCWLAGGDVRIIKTVRIGHLFRNTAPYSTGTYHLIYNKIRMCMELLDAPLREYLISKLPKDGNFHAAMKQIQDDLRDIQEERKYLQSVFERDVTWFLNKFDITIPGFTPAMAQAS